MKEGDYIDKIYWLWISRLKFMYYEVFESLMERYKSIKCIWNLSYKDLCSCEFLSMQQIKELTCKEYKSGLELYSNYMKEHEIQMVTCFENQYPQKLRFIRNRPIVLFYKGNIEIANEKSIAIVGSRACSQYGRKCSEIFSRKIVEQGINIVSGLAVGIDAVAHVSTLNCGGRAIAVIRKWVR